MSNKLITVRKGYPVHRFDEGGQAARWDRLASNAYGVNYGNTGFTLNNYKNSTNLLGISKKWNPFSKANLGRVGDFFKSDTGQAVGSAGIQTIGTVGDSLLNKGASNGVGNTLNTLSGVASAIPGPYGLAASAALKVAGVVANGLTNKTNTAAMNAKKAEFNNYALQGVNAQNTSDILNAYEGIRSLDVGNANDYTTTGFLASGKKKRRN